MIDIGMLYINKLSPLETVEVTGFDKKIIFKEEVNIVKYKKLTSSIGVDVNYGSFNETTKENFLDKYSTKMDIREEKLKKLGI
jgi:hypothetical protein